MRAVNKQIRNSPTAMQVLVNPDDHAVADFLRVNAEARAEWRNFAGEYDGDPLPWISLIRSHVNHTLPLPELRAKVAAGPLVTLSPALPPMLLRATPAAFQPLAAVKAWSWRSRRAWARRWGGRHLGEGVRDRVADRGGDVRRRFVEVMGVGERARAELERIHVPAALPWLRGRRAVPQVAAHVIAAAVTVDPAG